MATLGDTNIGELVYVDYKTGGSQRYFVVAQNSSMTFLLGWDNGYWNADGHGSSKTRWENFSSSGLCTDVMENIACGCFLATVPTAAQFKEFAEVLNVNPDHRFDLYSYEVWTSSEYNTANAYSFGGAFNPTRTQAKSTELRIQLMLVIKSSTSLEDVSPKNVMQSTGISKPTAEGTSFTYNGSPQAPKLTYDEKNVEVILPSDYTNVGRYMGIFRLKDRSKTQWIGGGTDDISFIWEITGIPITTGEISQKGTLIYNGKEQSPKWNNYDVDKMTIGGVTSATDCVLDGTTLGGYYTATFTPKNGYVWSDGTTRTIEVKWRIERKGLHQPTPINNLVYNGKPQTPTFDFHGEEEFIIDSELYKKA